MKGGELAVWRIRKVYASGDLVILVDYGSDDENARKVADVDDKFAINLHHPEIGNKVTALGFPNTENIHNDDGSSRHNIRGLKTTGTVTDLLFNGYRHIRESCFNSNVELIGGMSGGATLNSDGELCGINAYGIGPTESDPIYISTSCLLWALFGKRFTTPQFTDTTLYNLASEGYLKVKGLAHLDIGDEMRVVWYPEATDCVFCNPTT